LNFAAKLNQNGDDLAAGLGAVTPDAVFAGIFWLFAVLNGEARLQMPE
jgi:hypothetical protein